MTCSYFDGLGIMDHGIPAARCGAASLQIVNHLMRFWRLGCTGRESGAVELEEWFSRNWETFQRSFSSTCQGTQRREDGFVPCCVADGEEHWERVALGDLARQRCRDSRGRSVTGPATHDLLTLVKRDSPAL